MFDAAIQHAEGQAVVEYALVVGLVSAVVVVVLAASAVSWMTAITSLATDTITTLLGP